MSRFVRPDEMFTEEEIKRKRVRIHRKMLKSGTTPDLKEGKPDLRLLFELYDKNFFRGQVQRKLDETNSTLDFTFSKHTKTGGTCSRKGCEWKINIPVKLFQGLFQKGEKNLLNSGIWCTSKLDCLQITFEHELIHLLMGIYQYQDKKPEYSQSQDTFTAHGQLFRCMVLLYFGHTAYKHDLFGGEASIKIKKEEAQIGMRVKYFSNKSQEEYHGQILKTNPKFAKIRQDNGKIMNIPYTMLEKSDKSVPDVPVAPIQPEPSTSTKDQFKVGMRVTYFHKEKDHYGVITRINPKRAIIELDNGTSPAVPYHMLKKTDKQPPKVLPGFEEPKKKNIKDEIQVGDWVQYKLKDGVVAEGKITKKNPSRVIILMEDGKSWNIYYQNILGKVSNESRKDHFEIGDRVSFVINWPAGLGLKAETRVGTIIKKTPEHAVVSGDKGMTTDLEYFRLTKN